MWNLIAVEWLLWKTNSRQELNILCIPKFKVENLDPALVLVCFGIVLRRRKSSWKKKNFVSEYQYSSWLKCEIIYRNSLTSKRSDRNATFILLVSNFVMAHDWSLGLHVLCVNPLLSFQLQVCFKYAWPFCYHQALKG